MPSSLKFAAGVAATVVRLMDIESQLNGQDFSEALFKQTSESLGQYIKPLSDLRASSDYRMLVSKNYFVKFAKEISLELGGGQ